MLASPLVLQLVHVLLQDLQLRLQLNQLVLFCLPTQGGVLNRVGLVTGGELLDGRQGTSCLDRHNKETWYEVSTGVGAMQVPASGATTLSCIPCAVHCILLHLERLWRSIGQQAQP